MNINIFGVGRSGTKAIQLYLACLLSEKEGVVRINYEPYFYASRFNVRNYAATRYHIRDKQIFSTTENMPNDHHRFIKGLIEPNRGNTITKFIRGNGRIKQINNILKPDFSIIVIRNLYEVLSSVGIEGFNFYSIGSPYISLSYRTFWDELVQDVRSLNLVEDLDGILDKTGKNIMAKNAFYWYVMNLKALEAYEENKQSFLLVDYSNLKNFQLKLNSKLGFKNELPQINQEQFKGKRIHDSSVLENLNSHGLNTRLIGIANQSIYFSNKVLGLNLPMFHVKKGDWVRKKENMDLNSAGEVKIKSKFQKNNLFDFYNNSIENKLLSLMDSEKGNQSNL